MGRCKAGFCSEWLPSEDELWVAHQPPKHTDFRDRLPPDFETVRQIYGHYVAEGQWTLGLCNMWRRKSKIVKASVHVPCGASWRLLPWQWRGVVCGRTIHQCFWAGLHEARWARSAYAGATGRCYRMALRDIHAQEETGFLTNASSLCWLYCCAACVLGFGITQVFARLGACNFGACVSCFGRSEMRKQLNLPPTFGLPPFLDDCCVHFMCMYCATHQELRELAVRGVDGPGLHILDVVPESWDHVPGHEEAVAARRAEVVAMLGHPPERFQARWGPSTAPSQAGKQQQQQQGEKEVATGMQGAEAQSEGSGDEECAPKRAVPRLGWRQAAAAPAVQEMSRGLAVSSGGSGG